MTEKTENIRHLGEMLKSNQAKPKPKPAACQVCGEPVEPVQVQGIGWIAATRHTTCPYVSPTEKGAPDASPEQLMEHQIAAGFVAPEINEAFAALNDEERRLLMPRDLLEFGQDDRYTLHIDGPTNAGKSARAIVWAGLYLRRTKCTKSMIYTTERELIDAVSYSRTRESVPLRHYYEPDVLIIDECGRAQGRAWGTDEFIEIIVQRCRRQLLTITLGQCSLDELGDRSTLWEESVLSRLRRGSRGVHVTCSAPERKGGQHG